MFKCLSIRLGECAVPQADAIARRNELQPELYRRHGNEEEQEIAAGHTDKLVGINAELCCNHLSCYRVNSVCVCVCVLTRSVFY